MKLTIANKNYSSWSMRPWVLMKQAGLPFEEVMIRFDALSPGSSFKSQVARVSPAGRVPVLEDDGIVVWDTLAIAEYLAERFPEKTLWPPGRAERARARSICAEMHAGFAALRTWCPMNIDASMPEIGERVLREHEDVRADLDRISQMWSELLAGCGGPMLFGGFTIPDAYFAPVAMRIRTYALPVPQVVAAYVQRVTLLSGVAAWMRDALAEKQFVDFDEPYRSARDVMREDDAR